MKNMGLTSLRIVGSENIDLEKASIVAVHAKDILERARFFHTIEEATNDVSLIAGVSRRRGKRRKYFAVAPDVLAERICLMDGKKTALVFGNEATGLTDDELAKCHIAVAIPSSALFPSINLSHSVQILAYEIYTKSSSHQSCGYTPITNQALGALIRDVIESLRGIGFFKQVGPDDMFVFLRDILARAQLSDKESERMRLLFRKIHGLAARHK